MILWHSADSVRGATARDVKRSTDWDSSSAFNSEMRAPDHCPTGTKTSYRSPLGNAATYHLGYGWNSWKTHFKKGSQSEAMVPASSAGMARLLSLEAIKAALAANGPQITKTQPTSGRPASVAMILQTIGRCCLCV